MCFDSRLNQLQACTIVSLWHYKLTSKIETKMLKDQIMIVITRLIIIYSYSFFTIITFIVLSVISKHTISECQQK